MKINQISLRTLFVVIFVAMIFVWLCLSNSPDYRSVRRVDEETATRNNLRQVALALLNYQQDHGAFPPAYSVDDDGQRLHSWRVLILPQLGYQDLFSSIDLKVPWNDAENQKLLKFMPTEYSRVSRQATNNTSTSIVAVVGNGFPMHPARSQKDSDEKGVLVLDSEMVRVPWMAPFDICEERNLLVTPNAVACEKMHIAFVAFTDGYVSTIDKNLEYSDLKQLAKRSRETQPGTTND